VVRKQATAARASHWWWWRGVRALVGVWREKRMKNHIFHAKKHIYNL